MIKIEVIRGDLLYFAAAFGLAALLSETQTTHQQRREAPAILAQDLLQHEQRLGV